MSRKPLACRHCGKRFPRTAGAGLFCGTDCESEHNCKMDEHRKALADAGFVQHAETPNIWHKDDVSITEEQVKHVGFQKAVRQHGSAAAEYGVEVL